MRKPTSADREISADYKLAELVGVPATQSGNESARSERRLHQDLATGYSANAKPKGLSGSRCFPGRPRQAFNKIERVQTGWVFKRVGSNCRIFLRDVFGSLCLPESDLFGDHSAEASFPHLRLRDTTFSRCYRTFNFAFAAENLLEFTHGMV